MLPYLEEALYVLIWECVVTKMLCFKFSRYVCAKTLQRRRFMQRLSVSAHSEIPVGTVTCTPYSFNTHSMVR
jgi:hypothetical protein